MDQNWAQNQFFFSFFLSLTRQFSFKLTRMIAWNNVQLLVGVTRKTMAGGGKRAKIGSKISFLTIFQSLVHYISFKLHMMIAQNNVQLLVEVKVMKKNNGVKVGPRGPKLGPKLGFLPFSQVLFISFPLNFIG